MTTTIIRRRGPLRHVLLFTALVTGVFQIATPDVPAPKGPFDDGGAVLLAEARAS